MNILIIGSGYIGKSLAEKLFSQHNVTLTTRKEEKLNLLASSCSQALMLQLSNTQFLEQLIQKNDVIFLIIAPDHKSDYKNTYLDSSLVLKSVLEKIKTKKHLIYTSSTSVYGEQSGNWTTEETPLKPINEEAKILIEAEKALLSLSQLHSLSIVRLAEIYGSDRPFQTKIKRFFDKKAPGNGLQTVNAIHKEDVLAALTFIMEKALSGIFNLCCDQKMSRRELYDKICQKYKLPVIVWDASLPSLHGGNKKICNAKIKSLGYQFIFPQLEI